jgi:AmmeMemoRadiSam system protein B
LQDYDSAITIGNTLLNTLAARNVVVIASSDMIHYESAKQAEKKDYQALNAITALDVHQFYEIVEAQNVTICGYVPIAALMTYAKGLNAKANLQSYHNSGDTTGDYTSIVGYALLLFKK